MVKSTVLTTGNYWGLTIMATACCVQGNQGAHFSSSGEGCWGLFSPRKGLQFKRVITCRHSPAVTIRWTAGNKINSTRCNMGDLERCLRPMTCSGVNWRTAMTTLKQTLPPSTLSWFLFSQWLVWGAWPYKFSARKSVPDLVREAPLNPSYIAIPV